MNGIHPQQAIERFPAASALLVDHYDLHPTEDVRAAGFLFAPTLGAALALKMDDEYLLGRLSYEDRQGTLDSYIKVLPKMAQSARQRYEVEGLEQPDWIDVREALHLGTVSKSPPKGTMS